MSWVNDYKKPVLEPIKFESDAERMKYINTVKRNSADMNNYVSEQMARSRKTGIKNRCGRVKNK